MFVVWYVLSVSCSVLIGVRCFVANCFVLFGIRCMLLVVLFVVVAVLPSRRLLLCSSCWSLGVLCCVIFVDRYSVFIVCCVSCGVRSSLCAVSCVWRVVWCL